LIALPDINRGGLAADGAGLVDPRRERVDRAQQRVDGHGGGDVGGAGQPLGAGEREGEHGGGALRAVDQREPFLRPERHRREPGPLQRLAAGHAVDGFAFADEDQGEMRQRREVAAGAHRAAARHARMDAAIEQRQQRLERLDANARVAFGEHVGAQRHGGAHAAHRQRRVDAGGMTAQQIQLQRGEIRRVDARLGEIAEAGIDAVHRRVAGGQLIDHGPRRGDPIARRGREADVGASVGDGEQIGQFEMIAVEEDHSLQTTYTETLKHRNTEMTLGLAKRLSVFP
jgi:hypothetical protein